MAVNVCRSPEQYFEVQAILCPASERISMEIYYDKRSMCTPVISKRDRPLQTAMKVFGPSSSNTSINGFKLAAFSPASRFAMV